MTRAGALVAGVLALAALACGPSESADVPPPQPASPVTESAPPPVAGDDARDESRVDEPGEASLESRCYRGEREACDQLGH